MSRVLYFIERIAAIAAAVMLLQTLFYKFTAHEDSVYIFSSLGIEPYGRIIIGIFELITALLILYPPTAAHAALFGVGIMMGAIASHIFILGTEIKNDGGNLFFLAFVVLACCLVVLFSRKDQLVPINFGRRYD